MANDASALCCFMLDGRAFALDVDLVTEVVNVDSILPVPRSQSWVLGLFNLRGSPVPVVDLGQILGFGSANTQRSPVALVVKNDELVAAFAVDRMAEVMQRDRRAFGKRRRCIGGRTGLLLVLEQHAHAGDRRGGPKPDQQPDLHRFSAERARRRSIK